MTVSPNDVRMLRLLAAQDQELARLTAEQAKATLTTEHATWLSFIEGQAFVKCQDKSSTPARMWFIAGACGYRAGSMGHDSVVTELFEISPADEFVQLLIRAMHTFQPKPVTTDQQHKAADSIGALIEPITALVRPDGPNRSRVSSSDLSKIAAGFWTAGYGWACLDRRCPLIPEIRTSWLAPVQLP